LGTCYTYLLYDEFDWGYTNNSRMQTIAKLEQELPVATVLAYWPHYIVVDLDKNSPWSDNAQLLGKYCDSAYYYDEYSQYELRDMEFGKTKSNYVEENQSKHRNQEYIKEANDQWMKTNGYSNHNN
jgi:hypothetical protein